jgi:hypothetical protein
MARDKSLKSWCRSSSGGDVGQTDLDRGGVALKFGYHMAEM